MVVPTWLQKKKKEKRKKEKRKITYEFVCNQSIIRIHSYDLVKKRPRCGRAVQALIIRIDTCELSHTNSHVINKSYEFVVTTWHPLGGMIKIMTNTPPCDSANMRPLLDGMDKIKAFCRDVIAIVCKASEMTRGPTRVCPHKFSCILRPITVSGSSRGRTGLPRIFVSWKRKFVS
jgi:hypothetical protein